MSFILWNRSGVGEFYVRSLGYSLMSESFLTSTQDAQGAQDQRLVLQFSLLAATLIGAGLGLMLLG
jgi:hypothetical protein